MNFFLEDDDDENFYFPTNFNKQRERKPKSRLGRRKGKGEYATHPITPSQGLSDGIKQNDALRDIANILQEPNPVLNDSFVSDCSSTATSTESRTKGFSDFFKTPSQSFYLPSAEDSPLDPLKGILESPGPPSHSVCSTVKKNLVHKTLFGKSNDVDNLFVAGVCSLDNKRNLLAQCEDLPEVISDVNKHATKTTRPIKNCMAISHNSESVFKTDSAPFPSKSQYLDVFQECTPSVERYKNHGHSDLSHSNQMGCRLDSDARERKPHIDGPSSNRSSSNVLISPLLKKNNKDSHFPPFSFKPIPDIDKITTNFSSIFSNFNGSGPTVEQSKKYPSSNRILPTSLNEGLSDIGLLPKGNHKSFPAKCKLAKRTAHIESSPAVEDENRSSLRQKASEVSRMVPNPINSHSDAVDGIPSSILLTSIKYKLESYPEAKSSCGSSFFKRELKPKDIRTDSIFDKCQSSIHSNCLQLQGRERRDSDTKLDIVRVRSNSCSAAKPNFTDPLEHKLVHNQLARTSTSVENIISVRAHGDGEGIAHKTPNGAQALSHRAKSDFSIVDSAHRTPKIHSSSSLYMSKDVPKEQIKSSNMNKPEQKVKPSDNLFQASLLKNKYSVLDGTEVHNNNDNLGCRSSLFQSSIINCSNENSSQPIRKEELVVKEPLEKGSGVTKEPLERKVDLFKKPCSVVPRQTKLNRNLPDRVYVNGVAYPVLSLLGQGGSSKVYQSLKEDNNLVAIKCVNLQSVDPSVANSFLNEISLLEALQCCPSVIKMFNYEYQKESEVLMVVMEKGDVDFAHLIKSICRTKDISVPMAVYYWTEMVNCVNEIHEKGVIHSDLKPANFLLVKGRLKLIDFGIASSLQEDMTSVVTDLAIGTYNYISPEALVRCSETQDYHKISCKSDVWSLGVILYQLLYGRMPYSHYPMGAARIQAIADPKCRPSFPANVELPIILQIALRWCLLKDPKMRPTTRELLDLLYQLSCFSCSKSQCQVMLSKMFPRCPVALDF